MHNGQWADYGNFKMQGITCISFFLLAQTWEWRAEFLERSDYAAVQVVCSNTALLSLCQIPKQQELCRWRQLQKAPFMTLSRSVRDLVCEAYDQNLEGEDVISGKADILM